MLAAVSADGTMAGWSHGAVAGTRRRPPKMRRSGLSKGRTGQRTSGDLTHAAASHPPPYENVSLLQTRRINIVERGKDVCDRFDFRQDVDNVVCAGECFEHNVVEEFYGDIDAAKGNSLVER